MVIHPSWPATSGTLIMHCYTMSWPSRINTENCVQDRSSDWIATPLQASWCIAKMTSSCRSSEELQISKSPKYSAIIQRQSSQQIKAWLKHPLALEKGPENSGDLAKGSCSDPFSGFGNASLGITRQKGNWRLSTHHLRVHMAYIGHPAAGDPAYGPKKTLKRTSSFFMRDISVLLTSCQEILNLQHSASDLWENVEDSEKDSEDGWMEIQSLSLHTK